MIYLDTHIALWLHVGAHELLSKAAADAIRANDLRISPMVLLEVQYLSEAGKVKTTPDAMLASLADALGLTICDAPFEQVAQAAIGMTWTRDPFDRIITAQAGLADAPLVTKDSVIRKHYRKAIW